jgi:hypothetical protein
MTLGELEEALLAYAAGAYAFTYAFHVPIILAGLQYQCVRKESTELSCSKRS